jgi:WD40 repeat protein/cell division septation protein DedD
MSKTVRVLLIVLTLIFLNAGFTKANDIVEFKYFFSDAFYHGERPLGADKDPDLVRAKEAVDMACKIWENATGGNMVFAPASNPKEADIIFEGWSKQGPKVVTHDGRVCLDEHGDMGLFSEYLPEAYSFTIFENCNTSCQYPELANPADADNDHRARIFFHIKWGEQDKIEPWFFVLDKDKIDFSRAQRDVVRMATHEIGHALGFCGYPDQGTPDCAQSTECSKNNASIMCRNQVHCFQESQGGLISLGGMDNIANPGIRDLTLFDKSRIVQKFFPGTKTLYGMVKGTDATPISDAVIATMDGHLTVTTDINGVYSLWRTQPGIYNINVYNPKSNQNISEVIAITQDAPDIIIKDFGFSKDSLKTQAISRVIPSSGMPDDMYNFLAVFSEVDNNRYTSVSLFVDGTELHKFAVPSAERLAAKIFSYYSLTDLNVGAHYYEVKAADAEGKWQEALNGSFMVNRPPAIHFAVEAEPKTVAIGQNSHATLSASLKDNKGAPLPGKKILFRTGFPGFFTPSNGEVLTDANGQAKITFTPNSGGNVVITARSPYGLSDSIPITCTSPAMGITFEFHRAGNNSFKVTSYIKNFTDNNPASNQTVKWRLKPSNECAWTKGPDLKTNDRGEARGVFTVGSSESKEVSVTITHIPTGVSGSGSFVYGGYDGTRFLPWKKLEEATEWCEWSSNGYFAVRHENGSGLSIYRISDWAEVWSKKRRSGRYHSFCFSSDGEKLVTGVFKDKEKLAILKVPGGSVDTVWDFSLDSEAEAKSEDKSLAWQDNHIYTIRDHNVIQKWSTSGKLKMTYNHSAEIQELRFNPVNESQFAAVDKNGELRIWDTENTSPTRTVKVESISTGKLKCLAWSHDGKYLSVGSVIGDSGMIYTFDTSNWSKSGFDLPGLGGVNSLDYNRDSSRLAVGHDNGLIVCNTDTYGIEYYNKDPVHHVRWRPDGSMLAAGGQIYVFDDFNFNGPNIQISTPQNGSSYVFDSIKVAGKISDPHGIQSATISLNDGAPSSLSLSSQDFFARTVSLVEGPNQILVQAQNRIKNKASYTMSVVRIADSIPPVLIDPYVDTGMGLKGRKFKLRVSVYDEDSGIDTTKVTARIRLPDGNTSETVQLYDDGEHSDKKSGDGVFGNLWESSKAGEGLHSVDFYAVDKTGNSSDLVNGVTLFVYDRPVIKEPYLSAAKPLSSDPVTVHADITDISGVQSAFLRYSITAGNSWNLIPMSSTGLDYTGTIPVQKTGTVYYKVTARDVHGYGSETGAYAYTVQDSTRPVVKIQRPATVAESTTSESWITVSGRAIGVNGIGLKRVTCNTGAENTGTLKDWRFKVSLTAGVNTITIVAEDQNGKLASDSIGVTYAPALAAPVFSPPAPDVFTDPLSVGISSSDKEATIHYTTDTSDPTDTSPIFSSPILVTETTAIKARSYKPGQPPSSTVTGIYTFIKKEKDEIPKTKSPPKGNAIILNKKPDSSGEWSIQLESLKNKNFADKAITKLKNEGYPAYYITEMSSGEITWYKIRMGSFKDRTDAQKALNGLNKYKDKAIIVSNKPSRPAKQEKASKAEGKKEQQAKTPAPALREAPFTPEKQAAVGKREKQISELKVEKESLAEKQVIETPVVTHGTETSITQEVKTQRSGTVAEITPSIKQEEDKRTLASGGEIVSQQDRKDRLESFLNLYCQTYASKDLDKFASFFTPDATENNTPFQDMLPSYRKNMEEIESFNYRIELIDYSLQAGTGTIRIQGKYFIRYRLHEGTWRENSGNISMELTENGNSYLVKRLSYP